MTPHQKQPLALDTTKAAEDPEILELEQLSHEGIAEPLPQRRFLEQLLARTEGKGPLTYKLLPSSRDYIGADAGVSGMSFRYVVGRDRSRVELYIASKEAATNERLFDELRSHKAEIESAFGEPLSWERLENSKSCRIAYRLMEGADDELRWQAIQTALIDAMVRFEKALMPFVEATRLPR